MPRTALSLLLASALALVGCGGDSSPTRSTPVPAATPDPPRSALSMTVSPNPVIATPSGDSSFPFAARFNVIVRETAGLACNINRINVSLAGSGSVLEWNPGDITRMAGTNFIAASGSLSVPIAISYRGAFGARQLAFIVTVEAIDAKGNKVTAAAEVQALGRAVVDEQ